MRFGSVVDSLPQQLSACISNGVSHAVNRCFVGPWMSLAVPVPVPPRMEMSVLTERNAIGLFSPPCAGVNSNATACQQRRSSQFGFAELCRAVDLASSAAFFAASVHMEMSVFTERNAIGFTCHRVVLA